MKKCIVAVGLSLMAWCIGDGIAVAQETHDLSYVGGRPNGCYWKEGTAQMSQYWDYNASGQGISGMWDYFYNGDGGSWDLGRICDNAYPDGKMLVQGRMFPSPFSTQTCNLGFNDGTQCRSFTWPLAAIWVTGAEMYGNQNFCIETGYPGLGTLHSHCSGAATNKTGTPHAQCGYNGDYYWNGGECIWSPGSPIILPFGKKKVSKTGDYKLTGINNGVNFDIDNDGTLNPIAWTKQGANVGFLAWDRDGDGVINSGRELFGSYTFEDTRNGFEALIAMAASFGEQRGVEISVESAPIAYSKLLIWADTNHNGVSEAEELLRFSDYYESIGLAFMFDDYVDPHGNRFLFKGWARLHRPFGTKREKDYDKRAIEVFDVVLNFR